MPARQYVSNVRRYPPDAPLALMDVAIGLMHLLQRPSRASSPSFAVARTVAPLWLWGVLFLILGACLLVAIFGGRAPRLRRSCVTVVRVLGPALYVMWALMYAMSALHDDRATFIGVPPYLYLAYRHHFAPALPVA